jgi:hypothetical protein
LKLAGLIEERTCRKFDARGYNELAERRLTNCDNALDSLSRTAATYFASTMKLEFFTPSLRRLRAPRPAARPGAFRSDG